jgi:predicted ATPase/class 3 adenylate cyclase
MDQSDEHHSTANVQGRIKWLPSGLHSYEITELCCESRDAAIFRGRLREKELHVLIKVSRNDNRQNASWISRDYDITHALRLKCAAKVLAIERADAGPALVYADEGASPLENILADGPLELDAALLIGSALADATDELHKGHLVHGNLNTNTVWFSAPDAVRILDFGLRRASAESPFKSLEGFADIRYVAPEQTGRIPEGLDHRTDIYAIGIILFRLLTGELPFDGIDPLLIADAHLTIEPRFPPKFLDTLPGPLVKLILKCLAKNPGARYFSANGLRADLLRCLSEWRLTRAIGDFALGRHDAPTALQIPSKLYGREHGTGLLKDFVRSARRAQPAVLLVSGPPGVGKTAFLGQLGSLIRRVNGRFASGKFDQFKRNVPHFSLVQAFQQLVDQLLAEPEDQMAVWRSRILSAAEHSAQVVIDVIPEIELVTGPQPAVPSLPPSETRNRFNRIFARVIQVLMQPDNPLCLFMDDLQWSDSASLELLSHVLIEPHTKNFLFVGAYRSSEVEPSHPLAQTIHALKNASIKVQSIELCDLGIADVMQLVSETLSPSASETLPVAELLHSRSQGNPLYLTQLLHFLHDKGLVTFDYVSATWQWKLREIQAAAITTNVLDLLDMRMRALPLRTRQILSTAACIGSTFDSEKVAFAAAQPDAAGRLLECVGADLLVSLEDFGNEAKIGSMPPSQSGRFRFLHDRIQQAAFDLVPAQGKKPFRLGIGRRLMAGLDPDDRNVPQVDILNNLNYAWELLTDAEEKRELARLNLVAGRKARNALAYQDALQYLSVGLNLLNHESWQACYDLVFDLHVNALECEYLTGAFGRADELLTILVNKARSPMDQAIIYLTKILLDTSEERYEDAIRIGIRALRLFDIRYIRNPGRLRLAREFIHTRVRMQRRRPRDLLQCAALTDPEKLAALKILVALFPTAYFLSPNLLMFTGLKVVNYSLREGISPLAATGFVLYALGLGAALDRHKAGYEFGKFAVELAERGQDDAVRCKVLVIFSQFIKFWCDPIDDGFALIEQARRLALRVGDHQYVNYTIIGELSLHFSRGTSLADFLALCSQHENFVMRSKDAFPMESFSMWKSCALALLGRTDKCSSLNHDSYNEKGAEDRYRKTGNLTLLSYQLTLRLQLKYLFGHYEEAFAISESGEAVIGSAPGYITVADHYLYRGLAAATLSANAFRARRLKLVLRRCLKRLELFARNCPENFLPYLLLLRAESARASGAKALASTLYNEAVEAAEERKLPQLCGLANERAALACLADGQRRLATFFLASAIAAYGQWGATAKVTALHQTFSNSRAMIPLLGDAAAPTDGGGTGTKKLFDDAAAAAASRAIAMSEKDQVLINLMQIVRAQAGAETALLIVGRQGAYRVEAGALAGTSAESGGDAHRLGDFSSSIINYVVHTRKDLILNDPQLDARFARCDYLLRHQPSSVMCAAVIKQHELLGVVYLEHRRLAGAFNEEKLRWLRILAAEVGLALWSNKLSRYRDYLHRFAPAIAFRQIDADPDNPGLASQQQDVSILFADLAGYTRMSELLEQHRIDQLVNRVFGDFVDDVHHFHGLLLRITGDELFIVFQDDDPRRHARNAADAALAIERTAAHLTQYSSPAGLPIIVNIGINSGMAAIGLQPIEAVTGASWRYDATGATVNIAARAREFARDGSIVVGAATAERIAGNFELQDLGEYLMKNVSNPLRLHRLVGRTSGKE